MYGEPTPAGEGAAQYSLSRMAKKGSRAYHVLRFLETECNSSLSNLSAVGKALLLAAISASFIRNKRLRASLRFAAAALPATMGIADLTMKIKKYLHALKEEKAGVAYHRSMKIKMLLEREGNYNVRERAFENDMCQWFLSCPHTENIKIVGYYDLETLEKINITEGKNEKAIIFVLIDVQNQKIGIVIQEKYGRQNEKYYEAEMCIGTWDENIIGSVYLAIMQDYIKTLDTKNNSLYFNSWGAITTAPRNNIPEEITQFNVVEFVEEVKAVLSSGRKRTYLFVGVPGTGKSSIIKKVEYLVTEYPLIYLRSEDFESTLGISRRFAVLRPIQPSIIVIEDLDSYELDKRNKRTAMFLDCIDDVTNRLNFVLLATANDTSLLHYSLVDRPGRIDMVYHIKPPQTCEDAYAVLKSKMIRLKTAYCPDTAFDVPHIDVIREYLDICVAKKFTQADIGSGLLEQALIEIQKDVIRKDVSWNSLNGDFPAYFHLALVQHLRSKEAIAKCNFSNSAPRMADENCKQSAEPVQAGTGKLL